MHYRNIINDGGSCEFVKRTVNECKVYHPRIGTVKCAVDVKGKQTQLKNNCTIIINLLFSERFSRACILL